MNRITLFAKSSKCVCEHSIDRPSQSLYGRSTAAPHVRMIDPPRLNLFFPICRKPLLALSVCLAFFFAVQATPAQTQSQAPPKEPEHSTDWTHWVRIGAFGLRS